MYHPSVILVQFNMVYTARSHIYTEWYRYRVRWETPATAHLSDGLSLFGVPAPGSGNLLTFIFNILDGYRYSQQKPCEYG